jgi:hypothetical protein
MGDGRQGTPAAGGQGVDREGHGPCARRRLHALLGTLASVVLLALPLAAEEGAKAVPDEGLQARGQAFWEARIKEDYATQYDLLEPKVRRQLSLTNYIQAQGPLQYLEARIEGMQIDEAKGVLTVRTRVRIRHPLLDRQTQETVVREAWVKRQGAWYRVYPQS